MAELNESQLMLLNMLVYVDDALVEGKTLEQLVVIAEKNIDNINVGCGMSKDQALDVLNDIKNDPELKKLQVSNYMDGEVRAACFVNLDTNEATIVYRGTGSTYVEWDDNCQGGYLSDTDLQKKALAFAEECAIKYDDITVSGHSKGGNMAQYVTVLMGNQIDRCVSIDGQGFSDEFITKYSDEIEKNKHKIRSVCACNDYVNILLTPIIDETDIVYLANDVEWFPDGHYLYDMYKNDKNKLNANGEYVTSQQQIDDIVIIKTIEKILVNKIDSIGIVKPLKEFLIYSILGTILGIAKGEDADIKKIIEEFINNFMDYVEFYLERWTSGNTNTACDITVDTSVMREYGDDLNRAADLLDEYQDQIRRLKRKMEDNIVDGIAIGLPLTVVIQQLEAECTKLKKLAHFLGSSAEVYDAAELNAKQLAQ